MKTELGDTIPKTNRFFGIIMMFLIFFIIIFCLLFVSIYIIEKSNNIYFDDINILKNDFHWTRINNPRMQD